VVGDFDSKNAFDTMTFRDMLVFIAVALLLTQVSGPELTGLASSLPVCSRRLSATHKDDFADNFYKQCRRSTESRQSQRQRRGNGGSTGEHGDGGSGIYSCGDTYPSCDSGSCSPSLGVCVQDSSQTPGGHSRKAQVSIVSSLIQSLI
jgi:hypothetical protein